MEIKIPKNIRESVLNGLFEEELFKSFFDDSEKLVDLLADLLPLKEMPSEDQRHKNALDDLSRHLILNDDWSAEYLFIERLKFPDLDDKVFVKFIEFFVSPKYQSKVDAIHYLVTFFTSHLDKNSYKFVLSGYDNKLPVYKLVVASGALKNIPVDIKKNDIQFFSIGTISFAEKLENHEKPKSFPSFILTKDTWNDYDATTLHYLFYYPDIDSRRLIGGIKIMKKGEEDTILPDEFLLLDENYCSLGMGDEFYKNLSEAVGENFTSVLFALRDAAFFPMIHEEFEDEEVFKNSLVRHDDDERSSRTISYTFGGGDLNDRYKFKYKFKPLFSDSETEIDFPFSSEGNIPKRIIALIGKNGTGKTQLLTTLAKNLSDRESSLLFPKTPAFGKVLAVSYSVFDDFEIPSSDVSFNYKYCGLKKRSGGLLSEAELEKRFYESISKIEKKKRIFKFNEALSNFIDKEIINRIIQEDSNNTDEGLQINIENYSEIKKKLSSGQTILLYIVVEILAEIRYDSLILFDEPETHLHPNAITQLVSIIYDLVDQFDSYCVIATHSPLIVQSLKSDSVYITEREENIFSIRKIGSESFGENLSKITDEIFGNRDVSQEYKKIIQNLISNDKSYEEVVKILESEEVPLSLNAKMYIKSLIKTTQYA